MICFFYFIIKTATKLTLFFDITTQIIVFLIKNSEDAQIIRIILIINKKSRTINFISKIFVIFAS